MIQKLYQRLIGVASKFQSPFLLAIRLYWGFQFFQTGQGKLADIPKVAGYFGSLGIPFPTLNAYLAAGTECFGGLLLLMGFASRLVSIPLAFTMCVAYATAHRGALVNIFADPDTFLEQKPFLFLMTALIVLFFGPGIFSVDAIIRKMRKL
ncbi:MAG: DoxX family protein [Deltaproteobacteria bacterium]|nr:DoxX family protein [Deltaproteobacteria bacterium]